LAWRVSSVNNSLNYWSFDTNFALTYPNDQSGKDLSFNIGHIYNIENDEADYQTAQKLHLDAALGDFKHEALGIGTALRWSRNFGK
jgi:hypothetical protein